MDIEYNGVTIQLVKDNPYYTYFVSYKGHDWRGSDLEQAKKWIDYVVDKYKPKAVIF